MHHFLNLAEYLTRRGLDQIDDYASWLCSVALVGRGHVVKRVTQT